LVAAALFSKSRAASSVFVSISLVLVAIPLVKMPKYVDFAQHLEKRGVVAAFAEGRVEENRWDPISKINVIDQTFSPETYVPWWHESGDRKAIQYDGGNQTSYMFKFDGDLKALRAKLDRDKTHVQELFWQIGVLASHYLKRDTGQNVLIIGSGGGQETRAALVYNPAHVDTVELVPTVVQLATGRYSDYIGDVFQNPAVTAHAGEGRSFLRSSNKIYDIIQIFSNHTSSSIAQGTGALEPTYLQTAEAYEEYFSHLSANGVLQINQQAYPRMITTAALAWKRMGRADFQHHVAVYQSTYEKSMPTVLIKMAPWTADEIDQLNTYLAPSEFADIHRLKLVENPLDYSRSFLSADFYSGDFPDSLAAKLPVNLTPRTDDKPYFAMLRKNTKFLIPDPSRFLDPGTAYDVNLSLQKGIPMDWIHLIMTGVASAIFIVLFVLIPLRFSRVGRQKGRTATPLLVYFSCLGGGFIALELVFINKFTHIIGSPLYTYSTVICSLLASAGIGSVSSEKMGLSAARGWWIPFLAIIATGLTLLALYPWAANLALALPVEGRVLVSAAMLFPLGFFLGMPFPLGVLAIADQPRGAIAWAWGMNGLFTAAGGMVGMLSSVLFGFNATILVALTLYTLAMLLFNKLGTRDPESDSSSRSQRLRFNSAQNR
jgi:spermidine synthase